MNVLNGLIEGTEHADASLEEIILAADAGPLFNNSAQVWNHTFYWNCLSPTGGGAPTGEIGDAINSAFGSYDAFAEEFTEAAKTHVRLRLGLAGRRRRPEDPEDLQRRPAAQARREGAAHPRRVGARLLHRLPQRPARLHQELPRPTWSTGTSSARTCPADPLTAPTEAAPRERPEGRILTSGAAPSGHGTSSCVTDPASRIRTTAREVPA